MSDRSTSNELADGIRRIYNLLKRQPPEITLTATDEHEILTLCRKAIEPFLMKLFDAINAADKILPLVLNYVTDINAFALIITDQSKVSVLQLDSIVLHRCNLTLALRSKILSNNWPIHDNSEVESNNHLLDKICEKCPTVCSFRLVTYDQLKQQFLDHATAEQRVILEKIWLDENDLRTKVKDYGLPLTLIKTLEDNGIKSIDDISDNDVSTLIKADQKRMKEELEQKGNEKRIAFITEQHARFKSNLTRLQKQETKKGRQQDADRVKEIEENKTRNKEAIKSLQDLNTKLQTLTSKQMEENLKLVGEKLNVDWKFSKDELNRPNELIEKILKDLNTVNNELESACVNNYKSDEEIISHVSGGIALYGLQLSDAERLGEKAQRPLLACPSHCPLLSPIYAFQSDVQKFTSHQASNRFRKNIQTSGLTAALSFEASAWGASAKASISGGTRNTSDQEKQTKSQSTKLIEIEYAVKPVKCFRIEREEMKLTLEAENALRAINNLSKAKEFLRYFNSHVSDGTQHIGGIFLRTIEVETIEETDIQTLETIAAKNFNTDIGVGYAGFVFGGTSVEYFKTNASKNGTEEITHKASVKRSVYCMGPDCSNMELFSKILNLNNSTWYIIDRDTLPSFVPIWEIIKKSYSSQSDLRQASDFIKRVWLQEAANSKHIPIIQYEIQRLLSDDYNFSSPTLPPSLRDNGKKWRMDHLVIVRNLDDQIQTSLGENFNIDELNSAQLLSKVNAVFEMISLTSYLYGYDFLPLIIQQPSLSSLLLGIANCSEERKIHYVIPMLLNIFTEEQLQQMTVCNIHLHEDIINLIRKAHATKRCEMSSLINSAANQFDDLLNIPVISLDQLPTHLISLMRKSIDHSEFSLKSFQDKIVIYIGKSLQHASELPDYVQGLHRIKEELMKYGWLNEFDGFTVDLTEDNLEALLSAISEIFTMKECSHPESSVMTTDSVPIIPKTTQESSTIPYQSQSDSCSHILEKDNRILYTYNDWLVDRPLSATTQPVQRLIDVLRHRLDNESILPSVSSQITLSSSLLTAKNWANRRSNVSSVSPGSEASASIDSTQPSFKTVFDILIHLMNHSDLLSQLELFRLLMERRTALPLLTPTNHTVCLYKYHINPLTFVTTKLSKQREFNLSIDTSLYRIAIISMRSIKEQQSMQWMQHVFSCHSLSLSLSCIQCIPPDRCVAEIGIGFIPAQTGESEMNNWTITYTEVLVLNVIGNYSSIWPFISDFADLLLVEELPVEHSYFSPPSPLPDYLDVITWKCANSVSDPFTTEDSYYHVSGSILQTAKQIHEGIICALSNNNSSIHQKQRLCLSQMQYRELYAKKSIYLIDNKSIISSQNFAKLRSDELRLQKEFFVEAEYFRKQQENKSSVAAQETFQRAINNCKQKRVELAPIIEQHPLIKYFISILSYDQPYRRALNIVEFTQQIDIHSQKALEGIIDRKNRAFDNYNPNNPDSKATQAYFDAKRSYVDSIIGLEHLWREISHLYTANPRRYVDYPSLGAKHLIDGFTLELLDGDAAMLNQTWIRAVFIELEQQLKHLEKDFNKRNNDIRVFVLSILGEQSSGKSTLLNWMYGIRFRASTGMTTRGVHIQLLKAENRMEYDYILILDTEGINAPEYKGLSNTIARDNRLATFAILPADATIILINNEADQVARDVLAIVMLAYQQSDFALQTTDRLNTKIFFVHTRVDVNDIVKLNAKIESLFIELKNNAASIQRGNQHEIKNNTLMFRDFRMKGSNDGDERDIKFMGKINYANLPPKDTPDPHYGQSVVELKEYIYKRVVQPNEDGSQWKAKNFSTFLSYLNSAWQCTVIADFTLTFKNMMDRRSYDDLQVYLAKVRAELALHYSSKYDQIESKLLIDLLQYQAKSEDIEHETCQNLIQQYQGELTAIVQKDAITIHNKVLKDLKEKDELWQQWFLEEMKNWEIFHNNQKARTSSRIEQLITTRLTYDKKLIEYQQNIRMSISKKFQAKTTDEKKLLLKDTERQKHEFDEIYHVILQHAKSSQRTESVEQNVYDTYHRNNLGKHFDFTKKYTQKKLKIGKTYLRFNIRELMSPFILCTNNNGIEADEEAEFFRELGTKLDHLLTPVRRYDDGITQSAINLTEEQLQKYDYTRIKIRERAHQSIYDVLIHYLTQIHNKWEKTHSISLRLEDAYQNLWEFYQNTIKGVAGADLLRAELKLIFNKFWQSGFTHSIIKFIVNNLQSESWVNNSRVLMAYSDLELLDLIEQRKISLMIGKLTNLSQHYQDIIDHLIAKQISDYAEQGWKSYRQMLIYLLQTVVLDTKNYRNPICKLKENDLTTVGKGRTKFFLSRLCNGLISHHLPTSLIDSIHALNLDDFTVCDAQSAEIWSTIQDDVISIFPNEKTTFSFGGIEIKTMIERVRYNLINNQENESIQLRCNVPCPLCKQPCKRSTGHDNSPDDEKRRHDCDHQPAGLGGDYWESDALGNYNELCYESCSDGDANLFTFAKDGTRYLYSEFSKQFDWKQPYPFNHHSHDLRKYIFYKYQKELADLYGRLPCSDIPPSFDRTPNELNLLKQNLKHIANVN